MYTVFYMCGHLKRYKDTINLWINSNIFFLQLCADDVVVPRI